MCERLLVKDSLLLLAMSSLLTLADLLVGVRLVLLLFGGGLLVVCLSLVLFCDLLSQLCDELRLLLWEELLVRVPLPFPLLGIELHVHLSCFLSV